MPGAKLLLGCGANRVAACRSSGFILLAGAVVVALSGTARADTYPWCAAYTARADDPSVGVAEMIRTGNGFEVAAERMAKASCAKPDEPKTRAQVAAWREIYRKEYGGTDGDFAMMLAFALKSGGEGNAKGAGVAKDKAEVCAPYDHPPPASPTDAALHNAEGRVLGCDVDGWADAISVTEIQRVAFVLRCKKIRPTAYDAGTDLGMCYEDVRRLDRDKLAKELDARKINIYGRANAMRAFADARGIADELLAAWKKAAAADKAWQQMFDAAEEGWKRYQKLYADNRALFNTIAAFETQAAAGSRQAVAGCHDKLYKPFIAELRKAKPKSIDELRAAMAGPLTAPLMLALQTCNAMEQRYVEGAALHEVFYAQANTAYAPILGPRHAAQQAAVVALAKITMDREEFSAAVNKIAFPGDPLEASHKAARATGELGDHRGVISKIVANGAKVRVDFSIEKWIEPTYDCRYTHRIDHIDFATGRVYYVQECTQTGTQRVAAKAPPVDIPREFAEGLKPGMVLSFMTTDPERIEDQLKPYDGMPILLWSDKTKKHLIGAYGFLW